MKLAVPKETRAFETRVAASPDTVKAFTAMGFECVVEQGAGKAARIPDSAFEAVGAQTAQGFAATVRDADIVLKVAAPNAEERGALGANTLLLAMLNPYGDREALSDLAAKGVTAVALEFIPRITRAQSMDVLSSQANLAGYKAVLEAAALYDKALPQMMTAAGTVSPAKIFVMGAGVAGLQAVATAKRLGARVSATDVRAAAREQVESLGASFVMVESDETENAETAGGYAKEMSDDYKRRQAELVARHISQQDIVITTALIPGRPAPELISTEMVESMAPGAIIVDLAVEQGGNCALSKPGEIVEAGGVRIVGHLNMPGRIAADASALYARNILNYLTPLVDKEEKKLAVDWDDEIVAATVVTRGGEIVHPNLQG